MTALTLRDIRKKPGKRGRFIIVMTAVLGFLTVLMIQMNVLKQNTEAAELITRHISSFFVSAGGQISALVPYVSFFELLVILAVITAGALIIRVIMDLKKRRFKTVLRGVAVLAAVVLGALNYYNICAGFAYNRAPLELPMSPAVYRGQDVKDIADYFYEDFIYLSGRMKRDKETGDSISPYSLKQLSVKLKSEYSRLNGNDYFFKYTPRAKVVTNSWFMSSTGITGIAFLPTGEPNVNYMPHPASVPHTMAHEIAHTKGVMRENEADLVAHYILLTSDDEYLRYCGYLGTITWMQSAVYYGNNLNSDHTVKYSEIYPETAIQERLNIRNFWLEYVGPFDWLDKLLSDAGEFFNDLYLRINGVEEGTDSYVPPPADGIDTGETDPDTEEKIYDPVYSPIQKIFFKIYENKKAL